MPTMNDRVNDSPPNEHLPRWIVGTAAFVGGAVFVLTVLQVLATIGVIPGILQFNQAAVDMSKSFLEFLPKLAWPLTVGFVVLWFSDSIRGRIADIISAEFPGSRLRFADRNRETPRLAAEIEGARKLASGIMAAVAEEAKAAKHQTAAVLTEADGEITAPVADELTLAQEKLRNALEDLDERTNLLFSSITGGLGDLENALLICLQTQARPTMAKLVVGLQTTRPGLKLAFDGLWQQSLIEKEEPRGVARPTQLGHSYLDWLEKTRPDTFRRAASRYSGDE